MRHPSCMGEVETLPWLKLQVPHWQTYGHLGGDGGREGGRKARGRDLAITGADKADSLVICLDVE